MVIYVIYDAIHILKLRNWLSPGIMHGNNSRAILLWPVNVIWWFCILLLNFKISCYFHITLIGAFTIKFNYVSTLLNEYLHIT